MDKKFSKLRHRIKKSQKLVMDELIADHNSELCVLCGSHEEITREHIIPQWAFEANPTKNLVSTKNNQERSYIKSTVPACRECNSDLLGAFEDQLKRTLVDKKAEDLDNYDIDSIIWWLQYLGYKLQLMDLRSRFLKYRGREYIPFLANIPVAMFWGDIDTTPGKVFRILRGSRRDLTTKWKDKKYNSLIIFETSNDNFHFFHKVDEFIFIEMPQVKRALFFFFRDEFESHESAHEKCMEIIKEVYNK